MRLLDDDNWAKDMRQNGVGKKWRAGIFSKRFSMVLNHFVKRQKTKVWAS